MKEVFILLLIVATGHAAGQDPAIDRLLEPIRQKHHLPAMAGAIVTSRGLYAAGTVGFRRAGSDVAVTIDDQWHLGSNTKAMTAVVLAMLVEQHKLTWDTTIAQVFPDIARKLPPALREVTLACLLSHRAGLPHDADWITVSRAGSLHKQRLAALASMASVPLLSPPGSKYSYSNLGYVIAGAMAEEVTGETWEQLITRIVFQPLEMHTAGFGGMGTPGQFDQPWQHRLDGDLIMKNGPTADNPPVLGPAGTVHCSIGDWARFMADQLRGLEGKRSLLSAQSCQTIHKPSYGGDYAGGWIVLQRTWGGGTVYTNSGSNRMNYSAAWMAPKRDFAVLVCTNEFADDSAQACDEVASGLITMQLAGSRGALGRRRSRAN